jgi:predicted S18 family serine protease
MANKTQKIIMVVAVILTITAAFITGMEVQKSTGPAPADIVIVGVDDSDTLIQMDIQPLVKEGHVSIPVWDNVTEYRLTYGH